jgi:hypothetical protein
LTLSVRHNRQRKAGRRRRVDFHVRVDDSVPRRCRRCAALQFISFANGGVLDSAAVLLLVALLKLSLQRLDGIQNGHETQPETG